VKARIEGRYEQAQKPTRSSKSSNIVTPVPTKRRTGRSMAQKPNEAPKKDDNWWEAAAIYEFMRSAVIRGALRPGQNHITLDRVANLMVKRYEIDDSEVARNVLLVHAANLRYKIIHPRSKSASFFANEPIYEELQTEHSLTAVDFRKAEVVKLKPRRDHTALERIQSDSSEESSDDIAVTPRQRPGYRKTKGRLSVLRPKSSKYSGKSGKGKSFQRYQKQGSSSDDDAAEDADSSAEPGAEAESDSDSAIQIDTPTHALSPSREKRKYMDTSNDEAENGRRKRTASGSMSMKSSPTSATDEEEDDEEDTETATDADTEAPLPLRATSSHIPLNGKSKPKQSLAAPLVTPLVSTPLPTHSSNGPRDSWICTFDGCNQRIYGVSKQLGQRLVTEHLEDHAKGRHAVVGILLREEEKLRLPV